MSEELVEEPERRLAERLQALQEERELLARREVVLVRRESEHEARASELDERERLLEERIAVATQRELTLARELARLALAEREAAERAPEPEAEPAGDELPRVAARSERASELTPTLRELERVVEERSATRPDRAEEWTAYLFFLRDHADVDGRLPRTLDPLVDEVFGELL